MFPRTIRLYAGNLPRGVFVRVPYLYGTQLRAYSAAFPSSDYHRSLSTSPPVPSSPALLDMVTTASPLIDLSCASMRGCSSSLHIPSQDHIPRGTCGGALPPSPFFDYSASSSADQHVESAEDSPSQCSTNHEDRRSGGDQSIASQGSCWSPSYIRRKYPSK